MPNNIYSDNLIKRKSSSKSGFLTLFLVVISLALSITSAMLFSNFITVGSFNFSSAQNKKNGFTVYAIKLNQSTTKSGAEVLANDISFKGGAGYIYMANGVFNILSAGYKEKTDAEKVLTQLTSKGHEATVLEINVPNVEIAGTYSTNEQNIISSSLCSFQDSFDKLYDMSISLDTKVATESEVFTQLSSLKSSKKSISTSFDSAFNNKLTANLLQLKISLSNQVDILSDIIENKDSKLTFTCQLKGAYFKIIEQQINLYKIINA